MPQCAKCKRNISGDCESCVACGKDYHPGCANAYVNQRNARACCITSLTSSYRSIRHKTALNRQLNMAQPPGNDSNPFHLNSLASNTNIAPSTAIATCLSTPTSSVFTSVTSTLSNHTTSVISTTTSSIASTLPSSTFQPVDSISTAGSTLQIQSHEFVALSQQNSAISAQLTQLNVGMNQLNSKLERIELRLDNLTSMVYDQENRIKDLEEKVANLYVELTKFQDNAPTSIPLSISLPQSSDILINGLPSSTTTSHLEIVSHIFNSINASRFIQDILNISLYNQSKSSPNPATTTSSATPTSTSVSTFSLIVKLKSTQVRDEIVNLKRSKGDLLASSIFADSHASLQQKLYLNEWLPPPLFKLFMETRKVAKQRGYERAWVRSEVISVRKCADAPRIIIGCSADLEKLE